MKIKIPKVLKIKMRKNIKVAKLTLENFVTNKNQNEKAQKKMRRTREGKIICSHNFITYRGDLAHSKLFLCQLKINLAVTHLFMSTKIAD